MVKTIIFDIDGVLIEADTNIRLEKYKDIFKQGMKLVKSKDYQNSTQLFEELKQRYDKGKYCVKMNKYKLINKDTSKILSELSKNYKLFACSMTSKNVSISKLRATGILKHFDKILTKPLGEGNKSIAVVDDRFNAGFGQGFYIIKFNYGQHKKEQGECDMKINNLKELCIINN